MDRPGVPALYCKGTFGPGAFGYVRGEHNLQLARLAIGAPVTFVASDPPD